MYRKSGYLCCAVALLNIGVCPLLIIAQGPPTNSFNPPSTDVTFASVSAIANSTQNPSKDEESAKVVSVSNAGDGGLSPQSNLSSHVTENNYYDDDETEDGNETPEKTRGMRSETTKEGMRLSLLKQIQSLDHMKCFPKVLCGLSVDSSKNSKDMDSYLVRSYIQLMRSANPMDDNSEETKGSSSDPKNDALSMFLMKSGLLKPKTKKRPSSQSASSSEEGSYEPQPKRHKSRLERKNEALKSLLGKRRLDKDTEGIRPDDKENPFRHRRPIIHLSSGGQDSGALMKEELSFLDEGNENPSSVTSQIGSLVSSWVPWVNLSFGKDDSFEKDPFFKGGGTAAKVNKKKEEEWQHNLDKLAMLMAVKEAEMRRKRKNKSRSGRNDEGRNFRAISSMDEEIQVYSTAVDIGKKLKDTKQCDYLYNGCPVPYANIIKIIASIRKDIKESDETVESLSKEILEYSQQKKATKGSASNNRQKPQGPKKPLQNKQPMTLISHTLPNGEKVEINVQLSAKENGDGEVEIESPYGDSYVADEEPEANEDTSGVDEFQAVADPLEVDAEGDDPAISASYELAAEKLEGIDHRKPSPSQIFNKLNKRKKKKGTAPPPTTTETPSTTTPTPKYMVSKKRRPPTTTTPSPSRRTRKPRPKPTSTPPKRRTPPTWATTPVTSKRPKPTTGQPTVKPRSPSLKSSKTTTTTTTTSTTTSKPKTKNKNKATTSSGTDTVQNSSEESTTPIWSKIAATTGVISSSKKNTKPLRTKGSTGNRPFDHEIVTPGKKSAIKRTTTPKPKLISTGRPISEEEISVPSRITIEIDKSPEQEDETKTNTSDSSSSEEEKVTTTNEPTFTTSTTSRKPVRPRSKVKPATPPTTTTSSTTTTTTTPSPLSLLTQSYYDKVIADMFKSTESPTRKTTTQPPTTPPSKRRRKPISYNKKFQYSPQGQGHGHGVKNNSTTFDEIYGMSVESGSGEVRPFNMAQLGEIGNPNPWTEPDPDIPKDPPSPDMDDPTDVGSPIPGKKRITYKNGKRPYLVLMKPGNGVRLTTSGQLSSGTMGDRDTTNHNNSPQTSQYYSPTTQGEGIAPLVIEPGTHASDYSHWSPNY